MKKQIYLTIVGMFISLNLLFAAPGPKVLIIGAADDSWITDVKNKLSATSSFSVIDTFNSANGTPSVTTMQSYDCILNFQDQCAQNTTQLYDSLVCECWRSASKFNFCSS